MTGCMWRIPLYVRHVRIDLLDAAWAVAMSRTIVPFTRVYRVGVWFGFVMLCLHCFLRVSTAGLIVVLIPGHCWPSSAFPV